MRKELIVLALLLAGIIAVAPVVGYSWAPSYTTYPYFGSSYNYGYWFSNPYAVSIMNSLNGIINGWW